MLQLHMCNCFSKPEEEEIPETPLEPASEKLPEANGDDTVVEAKGVDPVMNVGGPSVEGRGRRSRPSEGARRSRLSGLAKVSWREYEINMKWFFHPSTMILMCVQNTGYLVNTTIPDISFIGYVLTYCVGIFPSRPWYAVVIAMAGLAPRWGTICGGLLFAVLSAAAWYIKQSGSVGLALAIIVWVPSVLPFVKKRLFMVAVVAWLLLVQMLIALFLQNQAKIVEALGLSRVLSGLVLPTVAAVYTSGGFASICLLYSCFDTEGVPRIVMSMMIFACVGTTQILQLSGLVEAAKNESLDVGLQQMSVTVVAAVAGDVWKRCVISSRIFHWVTGGRYPFVIEAERDLYIRSGYYIDFTVLPSFLFIGIWSWANEIPFAQRPLFWIAFPVFISMSLFSDLVMLVIHKIYYPVENETFIQLVKRLNMPGQNFPSSQNDGGRRFYHYKETGQFLNLQSEAASAGECLQEDLNVWKAKWSQHPILHDDLCAVMGYMVLMTNMSRIAFVAFFGTCGITIAEHLCEEVYGAEECNRGDVCVITTTTA